VSGSDEDRFISEWRTDSRFYRRRPGIGWLLALIVVPLLLALIGWGTSDGSTGAEVASPSAPAPTAAAAPPAATPTGQFGAMSIVRTAKGFTLRGDVPDQSMKVSLPDAIRQAMPGAVIGDELSVRPGVRAPEIAGLGGLFGAAADVEGFGANLVGGTATLTGTVSSGDAKATAESAAKATWPNVAIANDIQVNGVAAPAPAGGCATLQADITGLLKTPVTFDTDGFTLATGSRRLVGQIADKVKACPGTKLAVIGYTDTTGGDAINVPLSAKRAKSVADGLVSDGIAARDVSSSGRGAANPVADNGTPAGRAQNRRVEITVG
jgi:peptidoglycan-binding protein ArfA